MEGQISIFDLPEYLPDPKENECRACDWYDKKKFHCSWLIYDYLPKDKKKHEKGNCDEWKPDALMFKSCASCKYSNSFIYKGNDMFHPEEEPNIYCTHRDGSLNRRCRWPDKIERNFGIGTWHRQHEYDVCDRWEVKDIWKKYCKGL